MNNFTTSDYIDGVCTVDQYVNQFKNTATNIVVGGNYVQHPGTWQEGVYEVVYIDDNIALAKGVSGMALNISNNANYIVVRNSGPFVGWIKNDNRPEYRLQNIV